MLLLLFLTATLIVSRLCTVSCVKPILVISSYDYIMSVCDVLLCVALYYVSRVLFFCFVLFVIVLLYVIVRD